METFSASLVLCEGNPSVTGGFPLQWPVTRSFDVFFDVRLNKRLNKQLSANFSLLLLVGNSKVETRNHRYPRHPKQLLAQINP